MNKVLALLGVVVVAVIVYTTMGPQTDGGASDADVAQTSTAVAPTTAFIEDERIKNAASEPGNWLSFGRTYEEQRHSPLTQVNGNMGGSTTQLLSSNPKCKPPPFVKLLRPMQLDTVAAKGGTTADGPPLSPTMRH